MSLKGNRITAKANRTTSTPRRATAAKATIKRLAPQRRSTPSGAMQNSPLISNTGLRWGQAMSAHPRPRAGRRSHFEAMDKLNQALDELANTINAPYAVDTHIIENTEDDEICRNALSPS
jgi:hypothetical protein